MMHNVNKFYGDNQPKWSPTIASDSIDENMSLNIQRLKGYNIYLFDKIFTKEACDALISDFDNQELYPVGVDGYCDPSKKAGSYRAMAWSTDIAEYISKNVLQPNMTNKMNVIDNHNLDYLPVPFDISSLIKSDDIPTEFLLVGSTPWLRFMRYLDGGMHVPHHDAPYINQGERYVTMYSWVLYLNDLQGTGGEFQFIDDAQNNHPSQWNLSDWTHMSDNVSLSITPKRGRLLVFPHWLCHQVQQYLGEGYRYIIRGDVAYQY